MELIMVMSIVIGLMIIIGLLVWLWLFFFGEAVKYRTKYRKLKDKIKGKRK